MSKRLYLVSYDIRDPARLGRVHRFVKERALALQYSVFVLEGDDTARIEMSKGIEALIDPEADDVRIYGLPEGVEVEAIGDTDPLPRGVVLVGAGSRLSARARRSNGPPEEPAPAEVGTKQEAARERSKGPSN